MVSQSVERTVRISKLFDLYGPLLTDRQRGLLELHYLQDLSLGEIADQDGVTRQAVHDQLSRAERALESFEERLGLLGRRSADRSRLETVRDLLQRKEHARALALLSEIIDE